MICHLCTRIRRLPSDLRPLVINFVAAKKSCHHTNNTNRALPHLLGSARLYVQLNSSHMNIFRNSLISFQGKRPLGRVEIFIPLNNNCVTSHGFIRNTQSRSRVAVALLFDFFVLHAAVLPGSETKAQGSGDFSGAV